jgi:hypothetical protein
LIFENTEWQQTIMSVRDDVHIDGRGNGHSQQGNAEHDTLHVE